MLRHNIMEIDIDAHLKKIVTTNQLSVKLVESVAIHEINSCIVN